MVRNACKPCVHMFITHLLHLVCLGSEKLEDRVDIDRDREDQVRRKYVRKSKNLGFGLTKFALLNPERCAVGRCIQQFLVQRRLRYTGGDNLYRRYYLRYVLCEFTLPKEMNIKRKQFQGRVYIKIRRKVGSSQENGEVAIHKIEGKPWECCFLENKVLPPEFRRDAQAALARQ